MVALGVRRRWPLAACAVTLLLLGACSPQDPSGDTAAPAVGNVVILCLDTLRVDHLGAYGYERDTSPNIDALAAQGALFELTQAQSNWTVPATASLLTALYPSSHGAGLQGDVRQLAADTPPGQIRKEALTLGEILHEAGFGTGLFSANPFLYGRFKAGFDVAEVGRRNATELTNLALGWLQGVHQEPFFLYLQYMDLHQPIEPPDPYFNYFEVTEGGTRGKEHTDWSFGQQVDLEDPAFKRFRAHRVALYDGALRYVDAEVGRLLERLAQLGVAERTLVIVTSDHGEEFWDHAGIERELGGDPRGIWGVGHGHAMFQELLHVPLIFHGPGIGAGKRIECASRHLDVAPTVLSLLGQPERTGMRGRSLAPFLRPDPRPALCEPVALVAESPAYGPDSQALIWKGRKLIVRQDGVALLYDLRRDPLERTDLSASQPEVVKALRLLLARELSETAPAGASESLPFDEETRRQLESLGYIR